MFFQKYPEYYQLIEHPIDLKMVAQRIQAKQYKTVDDLEDDFALLFNNACSFNEPGSRIFKDARTLKKLVQLRKNDLLQILNAKKTVRLRWVALACISLVDITHSSWLHFWCCVLFCCSVLSHMMDFSWYTVHRLHWFQFYISMEGKVNIPPSASCHWI